MLDGGGGRVKCPTPSQTSCSAVAKRPRDASCLTVVNFNGTKCRVVFYCYLVATDLTARAIKCILSRTPQSLAKLAKKA